jgi:hypothetical protein
MNRVFEGIAGWPANLESFFFIGRGNCNWFDKLAQFTTNQDVCESP